MKNKICSKTLSGKHEFIRQQYGYIKNTDNELMGIPRYVLRCDFCGIIDDRKKKKWEKDISL